MIITIVDSESGDWSGFYIGWELGTEGHSIRYDQLLNSIVEKAEPVERWFNYTISDKWIENNGGNLPKFLSEIPVSELK